jgi:hypothetical protein
MRISEERQLSPVADEVLALTAIVRPILSGILFALKQEVVDQAGGYENALLFMLPRLYKAGDGDCGICFEYAIHEALTNGDPRVLERINDAAQLCHVPGHETKSILFGLEKHGGQQLIDTAAGVLTDESQLLYGTKGRPLKLKRHLGLIAGAFRNRNTRLALPYSVRGLWKADLFVGFSDSDRWVATSVKINPSQLEGAAGLRMGIVPTRQGRNDRIYKDDNKNLVVCPLLHDGDFMQAFYEAWRIIQAFLNADARVPPEVSLPNPVHREVARILEERRDFPVRDVVEAIRPFGQPELLQTNTTQVESQTLKGEVQTDMAVAPLPLQLELPL